MPKCGKFGAASTAGWGAGAAIFSPVGRVVLLHPPVKRYWPDTDETPLITRISYYKKRQQALHEKGQKKQKKKPGSWKVVETKALLTPVFEVQVSSFSLK